VLIIGFLIFNTRIKPVQKIHSQLLSALFAITIGFAMSTFANAGTPDENNAAGEKFLAENAKKSNIKTTASGLQYEVLTEGKGKTKPTATSNVTVHYKGTSLEGKEFDSSYSRGEPTSFPLNGVIPGWTEGVQLMTEGAKYKFYIPSKLAYAENGAGGAIGPNETLIFEVELIKIN
jgi:FKBP-type peptidyl-prolyl cis-trans isomerase FkpA